MADLHCLHCPKCGSTEIEAVGSVFVEDGPYNGKAYANEHDAERYTCKPCGCCFAILEPPVRCDKCGVRVTGEVGDDCDEAPASFVIYHSGMFWSNELGWTADVDQSTHFTWEEKQTFLLPLVDGVVPPSWLTDDAKYLCEECMPKEDE